MHGDAEVGVETIVDGGPAVDVGGIGALALLHEGFESGRAALFDMTDPVEEACALGFEDGGSENRSRLRGVKRSDWRVESIQHSYAVVLVEGSKGKFVDEDLVREK